MGFPGDPSGEELTCQCRRCKRHRFSPWVGKIPWRRAQQPTPVFLPGEPHGQRSLGATVPGVAQSRTRLSAGASTACHFNGAKLVRTDPASQLSSYLFKGIVISTFILTNFIYREIIFCCYLLVFMNCHTIYMHEQKFTKLLLQKISKNDFPSLYCFHFSISSINYQSINFSIYHLHYISK